MPNGKSDEEIRRFIVAEIASQIKPFSDMLKAMHDWQLGFWSNGSGQPEGFFQRRMREDDARNVKVMDFINTAQIRQIEAETRKKIEEENELEAAKIRAVRDKRLAPWRKLAWGAASLVLAGALGLTVRVIKIIAQDYLESHPRVTEQLKTVVSTTDTGVQSKEKPQDAGTDQNRAY